MGDERDHILSLAFMRGHPIQAARVLEAFPSAQAAEVFEGAPARLGACVLAAMLPRKAASCIAALQDTRALELLATMGTQTTVAMLRHVPELRRRVFIAGLPTAGALAAALLLGYTEDTLGAWADPDVIMLAADTRASDALERVRRSAVVHPTVFVTDVDRRLSGVVALSALLQAPNDTTLATLMQRPPAVLTAHTPLASTQGHPGWEHTSALPVVEPGEQLVGVMTRDALTRALRSTTPVAAIAKATLPALLARGYWHALSGLVESGLALLPRVPVVVEPTDER